MASCSVATTTIIPFSNSHSFRRHPQNSSILNLQSDLTKMLRRQPQYGTATALMIPILIRAFGPLPPIISFALPANATVAIILATIIRNLRLPARVAQLLRLTRLGGQNVSSNTPLSSLTGPPVRNSYGQLVQQPITLEVRMATRGGKGGFGSQLRAAGGKMSSSRNGAEENRDSCRDLNGRRLSTVKQARQLASYLASESERNRQLSEAQKKKYAKLEKILGRKPQGEADFVEAAKRLDDQGEGFEEGDDEKDDDDKGEGSSRITSTIDNGKGKKRERIDDSEFIEQSRTTVENVRSAVASAMLKKKKKVKSSVSSMKNKEDSIIQPSNSTASEPVR